MAERSGTIEIIALLGNPGKQYERTRHNAAWLFADHCDFNNNRWQAKWGAEFTELVIAGRQITAIKPQGFMNRSGESVAQFARYRRIEPEGLLVVHDAVELDFGRVAWKSGGGYAGHNGLRSLADRLGGGEFRRLRIGIGRPTHGSVSSYVLGAFSRAELERLEAIFDEAKALLESKIAEE